MQQRVNHRYVEAAKKGTAVTLQELIDLRHAALHQPLLQKQKKLMLQGEKRTSIRGRGIEFDVTHEYQPGDDIRAMAWRVTARSLKPHIKIYREEKEWPVWIALDLSPSLYFGTRAMFKSVRGILQASLTGWSTLLRRERIGAMISGENKPFIFQPQASEKYYLSILQKLAHASCLQPAFTTPNQLASLLLTLQQQVRTGSTIYLYSDFLDFNLEIEKLILHLAERTHIVLNFVYDPFEALPPPPYQYLLTNGREKSSFNMLNAKNREQYRQLFQLKVSQLNQFARKHQLNLQMFCTDPKRELPA